MNRRVKLAWTSVIVACAVVAALLAPTALSGWAPLAHWSCVSSDTVASNGTMFFPAVLVNAPYGGKGYGTALESANYPGAWGYPNDTALVGSPALNGTADGLFFPVNVSVDRLSSAWAFGPGNNDRCDAAYGVSVSPPPFIGGIGWVLLGPGNASDALEPTWNNFTGFEGDPISPHFENGFVGSNSASVTTCDAPAELLTVSARPATVQIQFPVGGQNVTVAYTIPFQLQFQYSFPADYGTWQVDNLSAPGGPGGGWAFSYSPCS